MPVRRAKISDESRIKHQQLNIILELMSWHGSLASSPAASYGTADVYKYWTSVGFLHIRLTLGRSTLNQKHCLH